MNLKNLSLKQTIIKNGEEILDLSEPTLVPSFNSTNFLVQDVVMVTDELEMRPDLIAKKYLGSDSYVDVLLKANEISNPFSIKSGDILIIPNIEKFKGFYVNPKQSENKINNTKANFLDPSKLSKKDKNRLERLEKIAREKPNGSREITTPNKLKTGDSNIIRQNGRIKF